MAYLLQPNVQRIENPAVPETCATDFVFAYPQPASQNYCCRPNTMIYGTAPYMAGKGAPGDLVTLEDEMRPQTTKRFNKVYVETYEKNVHPLQNMKCSQPLRVWDHNPGSTRASVQNCLFQQRYLS
tara:strand:+ start:1559 stop:1936 length:378 start_codon:yes stop_codon:yes gene_type:complete